MTFGAFVIIVLVIVLIVLIFGKADTKREVLNQVGLDLSASAYESKKESEFANYCMKAMKVAIDNYDANGKDEKEFLSNMNHIFFLSSLGSGIKKYEECDSSLPIYLHVPDYYIRFAREVVNRRLYDIKNSNAPILVKNCNYLSKKELRFYVKVLWKKYQHPWPDDWLKADSPY